MHSSGQLNMAEPSYILLVEDNPGDARLTQALLADTAARLLSLILGARPRSMLHQMQAVWGLLSMTRGQVCRSRHTSD